MPKLDLRACTFPGCGNLTTSDSRCEEHKANLRQDEHRPNANERGYDSRWRRFRAQYLRNNPLCVTCHSRGLIVEARHVDHIKPLADGGSKYELSNLQPLCHSCHSRKTGREKKGFVRHERS